jgi:hypothetical protein
MPNNPEVPVDRLSYRCFKQPVIEQAGDPISQRHRNRRASHMPIFIAAFGLFPPTS